MFLSLQLANLFLYCFQQLGIALGLGVETIVLVAYLQAMRDGVIDAEEAQFARAVRRVLTVALGLIIVSGLCISVLELLTHNAAVVQPAYLFKWALIIFILLLNVFGSAVPQNLLEGLRAGTWYALFIVHILAPVTSWLNLLTLYGLWMVGFSLAWMALLPLTQERKNAPAKVEAPKPIAKPEPPKTAPPAPAPKPAPVPPPKPIPPAPKAAPVAQAALPVVQPLEIDKPTMFVPPAPAPEPNKAPVAPLDKIPTAPKQPDDPWLPAIKIMPKSPQDLPQQPPK